jgi:hypothetical protein
MPFEKFEVFFNIIILLNILGWVRPTAAQQTYSFFFMECPSPTIWAKPSRVGLGR